MNLSFARILRSFLQVETVFLTLGEPDSAFRPRSERNFVPFA